MTNQVAIPEEFIIYIEGKPLVLYAGLLNIVKAYSIRELSTLVHQIPSDANGNMAIVQAKAVTASDAVFVDYGDASPESVGDAKFTPHLLRLASTRAKARVLLDAYAIAMTSVEEAMPKNTPSAIAGSPRNSARCLPIPVAR